MNRYYSYLNSAKEIINAYRGKEPLSAYLKKFFSDNKKYGSKDRKQIAHVCYCYFRQGKMAEDMPLEEKMIAGLFLCAGSPDEMLQFIRPEWNERVTLPVSDKLKKVNELYKITDIFPWKNELSAGMEHEEFCASFFTQPDLFLRVRPSYGNTVKKKLTANGIVFKVVDELSLAVSNASGIDSVIELDKEAVVQDLNSQKVAGLMQIPIAHYPWPISVWDCCAASGGKSIMLYDLKPDIRLTVSDIRESIMANLRKRFAKAGIKNYKSFVADVSAANKRNPREYYDLIIADVPCSGSGTWARTPEQLFFFDETEIGKYSSKQRRITDAVTGYLKPGGCLLYITCSVFREENEEVAAFIAQQKKLELKEMKLFKGYTQKADTLFAALLYKPL